MLPFFLVFFLLVAYYLLLATPSFAVCPVCTIAVGVGLGLSRYLGIDDTISGLWVGALILSSSFWFSAWLQKKSLKIPQFYILNSIFYIPVMMYLLILVPLFYTQTIGHPFNTIYGIDKLVFGVITGSALFLIAIAADKQIRKIKDKQLFLYQKVVFPLILLSLTSLIFYLLIK